MYPQSLVDQIQSTMDDKGNQISYQIKTEIIQLSQKKWQPHAHHG